MTTVGIFGASGFAREVADVAEDQGHSPVLIARDQAELDGWTFGGEIILEDDIARYPDMVFSIGIGENEVRERVARRHADRPFLTLIHSSATFGRRQRAAIEERSGIIVCAGVRFTNNIAVGDFSVFDQNATIAHDVIAEEYVHVAPGACISGNVHLGRGCWIGTGAAINQGDATHKLTVGERTIVGSGAVVAKDCDPDAVYVGVPARRIR